MLGRLIGVAAGALVAAFGYGLWKPADVARVLDPGVLNFATLEFGPFAPYRTVIAFTVIGLGVAIALAAAQRKGTARRKRRAPMALALDGEAGSGDPDPFALPDPKGPEGAPA